MVRKSDKHLKIEQKKRDGYLKSRHQNDEGAM